MTTTAFDDQFTSEPEPVHHPYSTADILRRNVADLEIALRKQTKRAEKAEAELKELREQVPLTFVHDPNGYAIGGTHTEIADALPVGTDLYTRPVPAPAVPEFCAVEAQLTLAETEMLNAKAWSAGTQAKRHIDFAITAIGCARYLLQSAEVAK